MNLYYTQRNYTPTATSAATGYPVTNLLLRPVRRPWRSGAIQNTTQTLKLNLGAIRTPKALYLHDLYAPCSDIALAYSTDDVTYTNLTDPTLVTLPSDRICALSAIGQSCRYLRLIFTGEVTVAGDNWVQLGRAVVLESQATLMGTWPLEVIIHYPQIERPLLNGIPSLAATGPEYHEISLNADYLRAEIITISRQEDFVLDCDGWPFLLRSQSEAQPLKRLNAMITSYPHAFFESV